MSERRKRIENAANACVDEHLKLYGEDIGVLTPAGNFVIGFHIGAQWADAHPASERLERENAELKSKLAENSHLRAFLQEVATPLYPDSDKASAWIWAHQRAKALLTEMIKVESPNPSQPGRLPDVNKYAGSSFEDFLNNTNEEPEDE